MKIYALFALAMLILAEATGQPMVAAAAFLAVLASALAVGLRRR